MRKVLKIAGAVLLVALLAGAAVFLIWAANPLGPMPEALQAMQSDDLVQVTDQGWLVFDPVSGSADTGFILYPGGRVDYRSYAPLARLIALHGYKAVIVPMPLSLAVFAPSRAENVIASFPAINNWAIAGHSLGGAMAASFTNNNPDLIDGLIFLAAYPAASDDLSNSQVITASIFGTLDGVAPPDQIRNSQDLLPETTRWFPIEGGNHAQFGWYGPQNGDNPATISREEQQSQTLEAIFEVLQQIDGSSPILLELLTAFQTNKYLSTY